MQQAEFSQTRIPAVKVRVGVSLFALMALAASTVSASGGDAPIVASRAEVDILAGHPADRCLHAAPGRELCRWRMEGRLVLPDVSVKTGALNLVCDLPKAFDDEAGTCTPLAAAVPSLPPVGLPAVSAGPPLGANERARRALAAAPDLLALSRLAGDVADACRARGDLQECRWELRAGSPGHARLATVAGHAGPIALDCLIPLDGTPRAADTCRVTPVEDSPARDAG